MFLGPSTENIKGRRHFGDLGVDDNIITMHLKEIG
jgi:hypothetical protein